MFWKKLARTHYACMHVCMHACMCVCKTRTVPANTCSLTLTPSVKERVFQALQDASKTTQDVIALQSDDVTKRAESVQWLDNSQSEVEDIVDSIEEYL